MSTRDCTETAVVGREDLMVIIIVPNNAHQRGSWREQFLGKTAAYTILLFLHALYEGYSSNCGQK